MLNSLSLNCGFNHYIDKTQINFLSLIYNSKFQAQIISRQRASQYPPTTDCNKNVVREDWRNKEKTINKSPESLSQTLSEILFFNAML